MAKKKKMREYLVKIPTSGYNKCYVDAHSPEEAIAILRSDEGYEIDRMDSEDDELLDELSLEHVSDNGPSQMGD